MFLLFAAEKFALAAPDLRTRRLWASLGALLTAAGIVALIHPLATFAGLADILGFVFALIGVLPVATGAVLRSVPARQWAARETTRLLRQQGVVATYDVEVKLWPLAVELTNLEVASTDGHGPALTSPRASVRPRVFGLLSGKLAIDQIEVDSPTVRAVIRGGQLANLAVVIPHDGKGGPVHAPFSVFSIADATVDLDIDGITATGLAEPLMRQGEWV